MLKQFFILFIAIEAIFAQLLCDPKTCSPPNCQCFSTSPPKGLDWKTIPQLVTITFDDAITVSNYDNYAAVIKNRKNPNGCPISTTFYITHEFNDYVFTNILYNNGSEIATRSVTHTNDLGYWSGASVSTLEREIGDLQDILATFANIPKQSIKGHRAPKLQTAGDRTITALRNLALTYDHSLPTVTYSDPPIFPYTLDYGFSQDCLIPPCPSANMQFSGTWIIPLVVLYDKNNSYCSMVDACARSNNSNEVYTFLKNNFDRHYTKNRAPFGMNIQPAWFQENDFNLSGLLMFLDYLQTLKNVYIVSVSKAIEWMKNPVPESQIGNLPAFQCPYVPPRNCVSRTCYYDDNAEHQMRSCVNCPPVYPWLGNPYGL